MTELPEPTWRFLLARGLPTFALEGFVPVAVFYVVLRSAGLAAAILASTAVAALVVGVQLRRGQDVALAAVTAVFVAVQAIVGLASGSATVYLAQPVLVSACWGAAYLGSAAAGRPLVGAFARAWYPFPPAFCGSAAYRREFGLQSVVWGVYCLAGAAVRLAVLVTAGAGGLVLVSFPVGTGGPLALVVWCLWHARRTFGAAQPVGATAAPNGG